MSPVLHAGSLFEHLLHICERPRMFSPEFTLSHLYLYMRGYEDARRDAGLSSQLTHLEQWLYARHPAWRNSSMWWGGHILEGCSGDLERALTEIHQLLTEFLAGEGAGFVRFPVRQTEE